MSTVKIRWPIPWTVETAQARMISHLKDGGYEVDDARKDWRLFMYRKNSSQWTQVYGGLTHHAKQERDWFKVSGPEVDAIPEWAFYQDGVFYGQADSHKV